MIFAYVNTFVEKHYRRLLTYYIVRLTRSDTLNSKDKRNALRQPGGVHLQGIPPYYAVNPS